LVAKTENQQELIIQSDKQSEISGVIYAEGNVSVSYRGKLLKADKLIYDKSNKKIDATGNVVLVLGDQLFKVSKLEYSFISEKGYLLNVKGAINSKTLIDDLSSNFSVSDSKKLESLLELNKKEVLNTQSQVENWLFFTDKMTIDGNKWKSKKALFSNDLLESKQVKLAINSLEITSSPEDLSEKLSIGGFEVESLEDCSENVNGVVLGKIISVLKHEGSDKLSICQVDIGTSKNLQIICGARNIRPNIYVYVATVGAKLNAVDLTIKRSEIRGVMSEGMICSLQELGLENSSEGIEIIDEDLALKHELGTPGSDLLQLNDFIYDLAITANRPDGMSVIGIAREISALLESTLNFQELNHKYNIHLLRELNFVQRL